MAVVVLSLLAATAIGTADFLGGFAGRALGYRQAMVVTYATLALASAILAPLVGGSLTSTVLLWGVLAGLVSTWATQALFAGIGRGRPAVVTPLAAVGAAALATSADLVAFDGSLTIGHALGLAAAATAVFLVTRVSSNEGGPLRFSLLTGAAGALGTGLFYIAIDVNADEGLWLFVPAGLTAALLGYTLMRWQRQRFSRASGMPVAAFAGLAVATSAIAIAFAVDTGSLLVVAALVSLFPAVTVGLAALVWHQRPNKWQWLGLVTAVLAVGLLGQ